jgi:hypothetical protein
MKGMKHVVIYLTTYSFQGHQKFTNSCNWQCSKLFIACQINLNQITCTHFSFFLSLYLHQNTDYKTYDGNTCNEGMLRKVNWCNKYLWTVNVKYTIIKLNLYFMIYSIVLKFEKIWLSGTLNIIRKPKKIPIFYEKKGHNSGTVNVKYTVMELNRYLMVHSTVLKFENIWLSHTLNIIRKPKKSLFSKRKRAITHVR